MEPILYHRIKLFGRRSKTVIVYAAFRIDVRNLLPYATLAGTYRTHSLEEFAEIIFPEHRITLLQTVIVKNKTFTDILVQNTRSPLAEKGSPTAVNAITYTDNGIETIKRLFSLYLSFSFLLNYSNFSNSCIFYQFSGGKDLFKMIIDSINFHIKQLRHCLLRKPQGFILNICLNRT